VRLDRSVSVGRAEAEALDIDDELAPFRGRFDLGDPDVIYVDGNSLGRPPLSTATRLQTVVTEEWGRGLVGSWESWIDLPRRVGDRIAADLIGAERGSVVLSDSTTVNLYKLASAALDAQPGRQVIVAEAGSFPTDAYVLQGLAAARGVELRAVRPDEVEDALDGDVALLALSHVDYRSGSLVDMGGLTAAAHRAGALTLWDLCHSVGAVPIDLAGDEVDLAAGCTYKYLNGGPGAPAFLYVRPELQPRLRQPIWGWFGQQDQFAMAGTYSPAPGTGSWLVGTPPILACVAAEEGIAVIAEAGVDRLREKSIRQTSFCVDLFDSWLAPLGFSLATPRDPAERGSHLSFRHPEAWRLCRVLIEQLGVVPDFREPDVIRYGLAPIYTRYVDVWDPMDRLRQAAEDRLWETVSTERRRVT
jgi:kynureninase